MEAERVPGEEPSRDTTAKLTSIRALPSLSALSTAGVSCEVAALSSEVEVLLSKAEWKAPAKASIPTRYLRVGPQDVTLRVPRLGQVCLLVDYAPPTPEAAAAAEAARKAEAERRERQRAEAAAAAEAEAAEAAAMRSAAEERRRKAADEAQAKAKAAEEEAARQRAAAEEARRAEEQAAKRREEEAAAAKQQQQQKQAEEEAKAREEARKAKEAQEAREAEEEILREQKAQREKRLKEQQEEAERLRKEEEEEDAENARREAEEAKAKVDKAEKEKRDLAAKKEEEARLAREAEEEILREQKLKREQRLKEQQEAEERLRKEEEEAAAAADKAAAEAQAEAEAKAKAEAEAEADREEQEAAARRRAAAAEEETPEPEEPESLERIDPPAPSVTVRPAGEEDEEETAEDDAEEESEAAEEEESEAAEEEESEAASEAASEAETGEEEEQSGEEEEESEEEDENLAELSGDLQLGCSLSIEMPEELLQEAADNGHEVVYSWHRSALPPDDNAEWEEIGSAGGDRAKYVLTATEVGCWIFGEWKVLDSSGEAVKDGATEASDCSVRLLGEDREDLKEAVLRGSLEYEVRTNEGPAKLNVSKSAITLTSRFLRGTTVSELGSDVLKVDRDDPSNLSFVPTGGGKSVECGLASQQQRDLLCLCAKAFTSLSKEPSFEQKCRVWEGDGYGDYFGKIYGDVMLLYEGADAPDEGTEPTEALMLHGCKAENVDPEGDAEQEDGPELSLADGGGEIFSLCLESEEARTEWREAVEARGAPPAIARASHILLKHSTSRRLASWRDPTGREIGSRTKAAASKMLREYKRLIENGSEDLADLAKQVSDCDTAKHGGDLGWFAANYMQPEFEEAVLALEEGELSDVVETASGVHLILRTG